MMGEWIINIPLQIPMAMGVQSGGCYYPNEQRRNSHNISDEIMTSGGINNYMAKQFWAIPPMPEGGD